MENKFEHTDLNVKQNIATDNDDIEKIAIVKTNDTPLYPSQEISSVEKVEKKQPLAIVEHNIPSKRISYINEMEMEMEIDNDDIAADKMELTWFQAMMNNQDTQQTINMMLTCTFEFYRVIMSTLLTLFVPQSCGGSPCSISDKMSPADAYGTFALTSNFITLGLFCIMYFIETKREWCLINYLDINRFKPRDNESVQKALDCLSPQRQLRIQDFDSKYKYAGYICMVAFTLNSLFSGMVVFVDFLDSKTLTVYLTNTLFMSTKLADVYTIVNTKKYIFLSSYLSKKIQYNDVDPDKKEIDSSVSIEE